MQPIKLEVVRPMVSAGAIRAASIVGQKGGYTLVFNVGMQQQPLGTRTGTVRVFTRSDTAIQTLHELGIRQFTVDTTHYEAGSLRPRRPDLARKNNAARDALAHDRWFREQVASTRAKIERGEMRLIPHDEFWDGIEAYARELTAKRDADNQAGKGKAPTSHRKAG